jgi:RNA polymerase sigma factor (sigma-70 family)
METTESSLIERARTGDVDAFARLVEEHRAVALRVAYAIAGPDAEDATQEAFIKAYRNLHRFRAGSAFRPWLLTIVANEARNTRRGAGRRTGLALRVAARRDADVASAEEEAVRADGRQVLLDAVATLRDLDREIVALRFFAGLSEAEMAGALDIAPGTVKSRLSRALTRLRAALPETFGEVTAR